MNMILKPVGSVRSPLKDRKQAPKQGSEGAPAADIEMLPEYADALLGLQAGAQLVLLTWLDRSDRTALQVHPRGDETRARRGVFATRSPDRPNPVGLHEVRLVSIHGLRLRVEPLEALDGTPVIDIKPLI
ncbi:tRNA (N6-threonylcarbamoyladenosine(37)-N6)-methyltransferase TrmO [Paucidesulfovibrio longus]|uniref:tRNA (N6-threonylcarbamoyladenosine(37)-N6)-methyltransferase TrmO n=1 Tax=Paucidesulfovibrio longus TaxID=889 RepID=UPI0003B5671C|nr:tRNA (N6-threonylcarbamoyladenosine(37)-N6)-methyltransferase TrmO [Paucidesulfovibrio longus]